MSYSWLFFNSHGHVFLNNTGRRWTMNQGNREKVKQLEKFPSLFLRGLIGSLSIFPLLPDSSPPFFLPFAEDHSSICGVVNTVNRTYSQFWSRLQFPYPLHECQFTHNVHWDFFPPRGNGRQESCLLIANINFCYFQEGQSSKIPENVSLFQHPHKTFLVCPTLYTYLGCHPKSISLAHLNGALLLLLTLSSKKLQDIVIMPQGQRQGTWGTEQPQVYVL